MRTPDSTTTPVKRVRATDTDAEEADVPAVVDDVLRKPGQPLDSTTRAAMENRLGHDFGRVRVHTDALAAESARAVDALAYTVGRHVVFGSGQHRPETVPGRRLLAHELTHVVQQGGRDSPSSVTPSGVRLQRSDSSSGGRYTPEERRAMAEGRVSGSTEDVERAATLGFQPGDIVFRLGSETLAEYIDNPVTHGGIYLGGGVIHDMVGFGNRNVTVSNFYAEAADPSVVKVVRFTGPHRELILDRLVSNIRSRNFHLPTDSKPWNLFSSADDYQTATCLEYSHAQFLYAIRELVSDPSTPEDVRESLRTTYYASGTGGPSNLISPQTLTVEGPMGVAINERRALIAAADYLAEDVDPSVFENRWEGEEELENIGTAWAPTMWQTQRLRAFTYESFGDSRRFFTLVTPETTSDVDSESNVIELDPITIEGRLTEYTVESGDTLWGIARRFEVPGGWRALYEANRDVVGDDPDLILPGQRLRIPAR